MGGNRCLPVGASRLVREVQTELRPQAGPEALVTGTEDKTGPSIRFSVAEGFLQVISDLKQSTHRKLIFHHFEGE